MKIEAAREMLKICKPEDRAFFVVGYCGENGLIQFTEVADVVRLGDDSYEVAGYDSEGEDVMIPLDGVYIVARMLAIDVEKFKSVAEKGELGDAAL